MDVCTSSYDNNNIKNMQNCILSEKENYVSKNGTYTVHFLYYFNLYFKGYTIQT